MAIIMPNNNAVEIIFLVERTIGRSSHNGNHISVIPHVDRISTDGPHDPPPTKTMIIMIIVIIIRLTN